LQGQYRSALLDDVLPFWQKHSLDRDHGGYLTCLDRDGAVYDTDKFVWLQARQVWMFSMLNNRLEPRPEWLETARLGADFLLKHGMDRAGDWYFSLAQDGTPLVQPYNIFSDCFGAMAFSQYALATGDPTARRVALRTYDHILKRQDNPKCKYSKAVPGSRPLMALSLPMILSRKTFFSDASFLALEAFIRRISFF
jgi:N-acylglucosamine 2-epimerase